MNDTAIEMHIPRKGSAGVITSIERILPPPQPDEVRVAIEAAGVAYADIVMRQGLYRSAPPPVTPGYDFVGRVEALGAAVSGLVIGQRVAGVTVSGSYANRRNVQARWLVPAPESASAAELVAAALNGVTAWQMLHRIAAPEPGEWVLVHGAAGGVGSLLLDLARLAGVKAIGSASGGKAQVVVARGAVAVDYLGEDVAATAKQVSQGGVVAAFDHIGGRHFMRVSMASLRAGGAGVLYGGYDASRGGKVHPFAVMDLMANARFSAFRLFGQSQGVVGYSMPVWREQRLDTYRRDLAQVLGLVGSGALRPLVGATFPLAKAAEAQEMLQSRAVAGKIVLLNAG